MALHSYCLPCPMFPFPRLHSLKCLNWGELLTPGSHCALTLALMLFLPSVHLDHSLYFLHDVVIRTNTGRYFRIRSERKPCYYHVLKTVGEELDR